jgi:predicted PurR-regulated permease PerM
MTNTMSTSTSVTFSHNFSIIIINFVFIMVLYMIVIYLFSKYIDIEEKMNNISDYQSNNERQLNNLIKDVNYNDRYIATYIENIENIKNN